MAIGIGLELIGLELNGVADLGERRLLVSEVPAVGRRQENGAIRRYETGKRAQQFVGVRHVLDDLAGDDQVEGADASRIEIEDVAAEARDAGGGRELGEGPIELVASEVVGHDISALSRQRRRQGRIPRSDLEYPPRPSLDGVFECQQRPQSSVRFIRRGSHVAEVPSAGVVVAGVGDEGPKCREALGADGVKAVERREPARSDRWHVRTCRRDVPSGRGM